MKNKNVYYEIWTDIKNAKISFLRSNYYPIQKKISACLQNKEGYYFAHIEADETLAEKEHLNSGFTISGEVVENIPNEILDETKIPIVEVSVNNSPYSSESSYTIDYNVSSVTISAQSYNNVQTYKIENNNSVISPNNKIILKKIKNKIEKEFYTMAVLITDKKIDEKNIITGPPLQVMIQTPRTFAIKIPINNTSEIISYNILLQTQSISFPIIINQKYKTQ